MNHQQYFNRYHENTVTPLCSKVMLIFNLTQALSMSILPGNTKGRSITVLLTSCLTSLDKSVFQFKTKLVSLHTADSKPVKQEVNGTVILPPLVFPDTTISAPTSSGPP
jgi:hypothetical protein